MGVLKMLKKFILFLAGNISLSFAVESHKSELWLVVGSNRASMDQGVLINTLWGEEKADLSHIKTFGQKATTIDTKKCSIPTLPHIVGDVTTFDFSKKYTIKGAFIERLSTFDLSDESPILKEAVQNIGNAMTS